MSNKQHSPIALAASGITLASPEITAATLHQRYSLGFQHMMAAGYFCRKVHEVQSRHIGQELGPFFEEILWNFSACVMCSTACFDAYLNEAFDDEGLSDSDVEILDQKGSILERYQAFMKQQGFRPFNKGTLPFQHALLLIRLRNAFVHHRPEGSNKRIPMRQSIETHLPKRKQNPFVEGSADFITQRCVSSDFAVWTIETAHSFMSVFFARTKGRGRLPDLKRLLP